MEKVDNLTRPLGENDYVLDDWTVIRWDDLTFDDEPVKKEVVESEAKALEWEIVKERKKPKREKSPLYKWPDKLAVKKKLTEKQKVFVDHYLKTMNATESYRASKWILDKPDLRSTGDTWNARTIKNNEKVKQYLNEKILSSADELLDIQMDIIRNDKMPPAVRMDWIKDRLNRMWVGRDKEESTDFTGIWEVTITIKHKQPEVIEAVETVDAESVEDLPPKEEDNGNI